MANKTFNLDSFQKGYFMSWTVTTQCVYLVKAQLFDDTITYFQASKQSIRIMPPLAQGAKAIAGNQLKISIDEPESTALDYSINTYDIRTNDGTVIGHGYNIAIEDANDKDYNDVFISLVAWKYSG